MRPGTPVPGNTSTSGAVAITVAMVVFGTVGALVATHVPANPLGWIFIAIGILAGGLLGLAEQSPIRGSSRSRDRCPARSSLGGSTAGHGSRPSG